MTLARWDYAGSDFLGSWTDKPICVGTIKNNSCNSRNLRNLCQLNRASQTGPHLSTRAPPG